MRLVPTARLAALAALAALGWCVVPVSAPPATAAQNDVVLVANQYASSSCGGYNEELFLFDTVTRQLTDLGQPTVTDPLGLNRPLGEFTEAKPIDLNRKILALWGGSTNANGSPHQMAAVAIYDRGAIPPRWTTSFALPADFNLSSNGTNPHSITLLPRTPNTTTDHYAIAQVGQMNGQGNGFVTVVNQSGQIRDREPLSSAHGVEWDGQRQALFAVGATAVAKYTYSTSTQQLTFVKSDPLPFEPLAPNGESGGHDLRRRRSDNDFFVTANYRAWIYRPDATVKLSEINDRFGGVKSIDQRFGDFKVEYSYLKGTEAKFLDGSPPAPWHSCIRPYKAGRWLRAQGEKVYSEDVVDPGQGTSWSPGIRVGPGANPYWVEVFTDNDVTGVDVIIRDGQQYLALTKQPWNGWTASPASAINQGDNVKIVVRRSTDGATAASQTFGWMITANPATEPGWVCAFTTGPANEWWLEVYVNPDVGTGGYVEARVNNSAWTLMTRETWGGWTKSMHAPPGSKVIFRAVRGSDGAKAYSRVYPDWPPP